MTAAALAAVLVLQAGSAGYVPDLKPLQRPAASELRDVVARFTADREALLRRYTVETSPARRTALREFYGAWLARLQGIDFASLSQDGRVDHLLLKNRVDHELRLLERDERTLGEIAPLLPFAGAIIDLEDARRRLETMDPPAAARVLARLAADVERMRQAVDSGGGG